MTDFTNNNSQSNGSNFTSYTKLQISSNCISMFDPQGTILKLGLLNESVSIAVGHPIINAYGKQTYPADTLEKIILTPEKVAAFYDIVICEKIKNAYEKGVEASAGVFTNKAKTTLLELKYDGEGIFSMNIFKDIDENRIPKKQITFTFNSTPVITKYNPETGDFELEEIPSGFLLFSKIMLGFANGLSQSAGHSTKFINNYTIDRINGMLKEIGNRLGIQLDIVYGSNYNRNVQNNNFSYNRVNNNQYPQRFESVETLNNTPPYQEESINQVDIESLL